MYSTRENVLKTDITVLIRSHIQNSWDIKISSDPHFHAEVEFSLILKGTMKFTVGNEEILVHEGECIYINGLVEHSSENLGDVSLCLLQFDFDVFRKINPAMSAKYFNNMPFHQKGYTMITRQTNKSFNDFVSLLLKTVDVFSAKEIGYEFQIFSNIFEIFSILFKNNVFETRYSQDSKINQRLISIHQYVEKHYSETITTRQIAKDFNLDYGYFCHMFKKTTGKTFLDYVNSYRVTMAQNMLIKENLTITEIMMAVGFNNSNYFSRIFKKHTNHTPSDFRKLHFQSLTYEQGAPK